MHSFLAFLCQLGLRVGFVCAITLSHAEIKVLSLIELNEAIGLSDQKIKLAPGKYQLEDLDEKSRALVFSGSNNMIDLTDAYISSTVGTVRACYIRLTGNNNTIKGGEIEDLYVNGLKEVTDFSAYNRDRKDLACGLRGDAVMTISGEGNLVDGLKVTPRGSFPYGYGSIYGIGSDNVYGLDKRCGILINGVKNTLQNVEVQQRAFGHGIYMQGEADETVIKSTLVEGRVRKTSELYDEKHPEDLPVRSGYKLPLSENKSIPKDEVHSLSEDGIRMYKIPGSIVVKDCVTKKMRGGIRLYLGGAAEVINCQSIDCGSTNWNLPSGAVVKKSSGNFAYSPLSDFRLGRSNTKVEWTILPSPHAVGSHNLMDILGNHHNITLLKPSGSSDSDQVRAIVITGKESTIVNKTKYPIILEKSSSNNTIESRGKVTDLGRNNTVE